MLLIVCIFNVNFVTRIFAILHSILVVACFHSFYPTLNSICIWKPFHIHYHHYYSFSNATSNAFSIAHLHLISASFFWFYPIFPLFTNKQFINIWNIKNTNDTVINKVAWCWRVKSFHIYLLQGGFHLMKKKKHFKGNLARFKDKS